MISTSAIRLTCVVRADMADRAVVALHKAFGLEGEGNL
jgi:aspartokinase